jgi:ribosomal protein S18 acetylase RimI-like enzyme
MPSITVRALEVEEWPLYRAVRLAALADSPAAFLSTLSHEQEFPPEVWQERLVQRNVFVAEDGDTARGMIGIVPRDPDLAEIVSMWVHPRARGRGVGDLLMTAALRWALERAVPEVRLWAAEGNHHAERLYERHGFQRTGTVKPIRDRAGELEFAMSRELRTGDVAGVHLSDQSRSSDSRDGGISSTGT